MDLENKKTVIFVPLFPVISETFIEREITILADRGNINFEVLSIKEGTGKLSLSLKDRVVYRRLSISDFVFASKYLLFYPQRILSAYKLVKSNSNRSSLQNIYLLVKSIGYSHIFESLGATHIHAHFLSEPSTLVMLVAAILGISFSISGHARDVFGSSSDISLNAELIAKKVERSKFVVLCNRKAYEACLASVSNSEHKKKIYLQHHGLDLKNFETSRSKVSDETQSNVTKLPIVLSVGRLEEKKGFNYLIQAAKILKEKAVNFKLIIIGPGSLYNVLLEQIASEDLKENVEILGSGKGLPNDQVLLQLHNASVFVLASIETSQKDAEGIPNTLIEAAAANVPIVSTNTGSIEEFISNRISGLIVEQKNASQLAVALEELLTDRGLASSISSNAKRLVTEQFDLNSNIIILEELLLS